MTTANKLTLARVALIPVFLVILYLDFPYARCAAFGVFVVACLTDFVDGYIARHYNQVTDFGKFMDPLADKVLVMAALRNAVIVLTTAYSGIEYFIKNADVFREPD